MEEKVRLQFFLWRFQNQIPSRPDIIVHHPIPSIFLWAFYLFFVETFGNWEGGKWIHFLTNLCTSLWNLPIKLDKVYNINIPSPLLSEWLYLREVFQKTKWKSLMAFAFALMAREIPPPIKNFQIFFWNTALKWHSAFWLPIWLCFDRLRWFFSAVFFFNFYRI